MQQFSIIRGSDSVTIFSAMANSMQDCVQRAISQRVSLSGAKLVGYDLRGLNARGADFSSAVLTSSLLDGGDFARANLGSISAHSASAVDCDFSEANQQAADWTSGNLTRAKFARTLTTGIVVTSATLANVQADASNSDDLGI